MVMENPRYPKSLLVDRHKHQQQTESARESSPSDTEPNIYRSPNKPSIDFKGKQLKLFQPKS